MEDIDDMFADDEPEVNVKVLIELAFLNLLVESGYRKDKSWTEEEYKILYKVLDLADELYKDIMEEVSKM